MFEDSLNGEEEILAFAMWLLGQHSIGDPPPEERVSMSISDYFMEKDLL